MGLMRWPDHMAIIAQGGMGMAMSPMAMAPTMMGRKLQQTMAMSPMAMAPTMMGRKLKQMVSVLLVCRVFACV